MKVVITTDSTHEIDFVPRFNTTNTVVLTLIDESDIEFTKVDVSNTVVVVDGIATITFDFTFTENARFSFTIKDGEEIVYRGKLISTVQEPQDYKLTNGLYE